MHRRRIVARAIFPPVHLIEINQFHIIGVESKYSIIWWTSMIIASSLSRPSIHQSSLITTSDIGSNKIGGKYNGCTDFPWKFSNEREYFSRGHHFIHSIMMIYLLIIAIDKLWILDRLVCYLDLDVRSSVSSLIVRILIETKQDSCSILDFLFISTLDDHHAERNQRHERIPLSCSTKGRQIGHD